MSVNQNIRSCLNCRTPESLPVFLFTPPFDLRVLGYTHSDYAANAETMVEVHTEAVKRFGYHWTFLHVDSCAALGPLGIEAGPADPLSVLPWTPYKHLPANRKTLAGLAVPDPLIAGRMPLVLVAISRLRQRFADQVCICGHVTAPFTSVQYLFGTEPALMLLKDDPGLYREAAAFMLELQRRFAIEQVWAGADAVEIGDLGSSSHFVSLQTYKQLALLPLKRLVADIAAEGGWGLYHQNEPEREYIAASAEAFGGGVGAVNIGQGAIVQEVAAAFQGRACLTGGIDPLAINRPLSLKNSTIPAVCADDFGYPADADSASR